MKRRRFLHGIGALFALPFIPEPLEHTPADHDPTMNEWHDGVLRFRYRLTYSNGGNGPSMNLEMEPGKLKLDGEKEDE